MAQNLVVPLQPSMAQGRLEQQIAGVDAAALRALAPAEVRRAPLSVWTALARPLEPHTGRQESGCPPTSNS
ncbi:hypothetical protein [Streptomyces sp. NPDC004008]